MKFKKLIIAIICLLKFSLTYSITKNHLEKIGMLVWQPQSKDISYIQQFDYLKENGIKLPKWLEKNYKKETPWTSREIFYNNKEHLEELQSLLVSTIDIQTQFIIKQSKKKLNLIIKACPENKKEKIISYLNLMLNSSIGTYALIDYLNFKGDGLNPKENKNGTQWGLLQVLLKIKKYSSKNIHKVFCLICSQDFVKVN